MVVFVPNAQFTKIIINKMRNTSKNPFYVIANQTNQELDGLKNIDVNKTVNFDKYCYFLWHIL